MRDPTLVLCLGRMAALCACLALAAPALADCDAPPSLVSSGSLASGNLNSGNLYSIANTVTTTANTLLVVRLQMDSAAAVSALTYGGQPLLLAYNAPGVGNGQLSTYYLPGPPVGTFSLALNFATTPSCCAALGYELYQGVNLTQPFGTMVDLSSTSGAPTAPINTLYDNSIVSDFIAFANSGAVQAQGAGQTTLFSGGSGFADYQTTTQAGPQTFSYTLDSVQAFAFQAIEIRAASEPCTPTPTLTATDVPTLGETPTPSATDLPTLSGTPTPTATDVPTLSETATPSPTPHAVVPTATFSRTAVATPRPSPTAHVPAVLDRNVFKPAQGQPLGIAFAAPQAGHVTVRVFDLHGGRVAQPFSDGVAQGAWNQVQWDGRDGQGERAASGVYFVSIQGSGIRSVLKVILLR